MFSFWGNHGFGDSARIPVGNKIAVENINWTEYGYIKKEQISNAVNIETTRFKIICHLERIMKVIGMDGDFGYYHDNANFETCESGNISRMHNKMYAIMLLLLKRLNFKEG